MESSAYIRPIVHYGLIIVAVVGLCCAIYGVYRIINAILNRRYLKHRDIVWLELTPPVSIDKTPESTMQLFSVIHGLRAARSFKDKLLNRTPAMSFELVSSKREGIRYFIQVEAKHSDTIQKAVAAYLPEAKVKIAKHENHVPARTAEFVQNNHFVLPLTLTKAFEQHDPLSYVTAAMTKLDDDEQITMQLIVQPIKLPEATRLSRRILSNEDILGRISRSKFSRMSRVSDVLNSTLAIATDTIGEVHSGTTSSYQKDKTNKDAAFQAQVQKRQRPARTLSAFELELMESMHQKVSQPLFQVDLRLLICGNNAQARMATFKSVLDGYSVPQYQALHTKKRLPVIQKYRDQIALLRLPNWYRKQSLVLSVGEVSSLYHFPASRIGKTDNLMASLSRTLPAPVSLKNGTSLDILLGKNEHHGIETSIGLTADERQRHVYIIGGTGNGKTTMLLYSIVQDIKNGKGLAVLDPHGDLAETILQHIPEERVKDVVYLNPDDLARPIGINLLEIDPSLTGDELLREKDLITESTISVLRKVFSEDDSGGHRIEYVLRNTIQTALTMENATLFTIFHLLNDSKFRREAIKTLEDKDLKNFWTNELGKAGDFQRVKMAAGITSKIGRFLFSASAKRILEQPKSTIDFDDILDSSKILICNFSKGLLGEDTSTLFGTTTLAKLQVASLKRARQKQSNRRPFYLYVDEFQNFATMSFVQMLSEARKYKLFLTMAEQSTSQQEQQRLVDIILANVGTVVCFRSGSPADERLMLPLFSPYIEQGEIANLPAYNFYARIAAVQAQEPMSGLTVLVDDVGNEELARAAVNYSRKTYGVEVVQEESVAKQATATQAPVKTRKVSSPRKTHKDTNPER